MKEFKEITLKRKEIGRYIDMFTSKEVLPYVLDVPGRKFSHMVSRNVQFAEGILKKQNKFQQDILEKRGELSKEYNEKEKALLEEYSAKDDKGNAVIKNNMYSIPNEKMEEFNKAKDKLAKEFPKDGKKQKDFNDAMDAYMEEDVLVQIYQVKEEDISEAITGRVRLLLAEYIIEK
jgi:hypothetical protein